MKICFATGNKGKLREAGEILGTGYELFSSSQAGVTEDIPETGSSFAENSLQKATYVREHCHIDCFADDSGLEVDALGGAPGIYSARYNGDHNFDRNMDKVLEELAALGPDVDRTARFRCVVTLALEGEFYHFDGAVEGKIAFEKAGNGGFGYDPIFVPDINPVLRSDGLYEMLPNTEKLTLSQISEDAKNAISHRGIALRKMAAFLKERR